MFREDHLINEIKTYDLIIKDKAEVSERYTFSNVAFV